MENTSGMQGAKGGTPPSTPQKPAEPGGTRPSMAEPRGAEPRWTEPRGSSGAGVGHRAPGPRGNGPMGDGRKTNYWVILIVIVLIAGLVFYLRWRERGVGVPSEEKITVSTPLEGETIGEKLMVAGMTSVDISSLKYRLTDEDGTLLAEADVSLPTTTEEGGIPFNIESGYRKPSTENGELELSALTEEGTIERIVIPVTFKKEEAAMMKNKEIESQTMTLRVYFGNTVNDPQALDCGKTYPVSRTVPKTSTVGRRALEELLKGPTEAEKTLGYSTSIKEGAKIQRLLIQEGVAEVDFNEALQSGVGGSCKVAMIRSQITSTLKQFSTVENVVISINGRSQDILQP